MTAVEAATQAARIEGAGDGTGGFLRVVVRQLDDDQLHQVLAELRDDEDALWALLHAAGEVPAWS